MYSFVYGQTVVVVVGGVAPEFDVATSDRANPELAVVDAQRDPEPEVAVEESVLCRYMIIGREFDVVGRYPLERVGFSVKKFQGVLALGEVDSKHQGQRFEGEVLDFLFSFFVEGSKDILEIWPTEGTLAHRPRQETSRTSRTVPERSDAEDSMSIDPQVLRGSARDIVASARHLERSADVTKETVVPIVCVVSRHSGRAYS